MSDAFQLRRLRAGHADAFDAIYRSHGAAVYRYACAVCGDRSTAEDLAQEAFLGLLRNVDTLDERRPLRPYLLRSVKNRHVDRWRSFVERGVPLPAEDPPSNAPGVEEHLERAESVAAVTRLLEELPETQSEIVRLRIYGELDYEAIAAMTDAPRDTVRNRYRAAIARLGSLLKRSRVERGGMSGGSA
ncbi:MAG: sigma-70 family RNA polymerase sigma factor [Planctomycetes bacterium]|nr:sigma-70 family RNA polymerase sigma factor [Planctomycetota bacterium]